MPRAVEVMKRAFSALSTGQATVPPRAVIALPRGKGDLLLMPAIQDEGRQIGIKLLTLLPDNPKVGLPLIHALMTVFDGETGQPLAVMDAGALTALRTGAASGAATDLLSRPEARTVAVFGAGRQGRSQLEAICAVRRIEQAWVFDPAPERAADFAQRMGERLNIAITVAPSPRSALAGAEVVCTATTARRPVFDDADLRDGAHINAIGVYHPDRHEIPERTVARAKVVVDQREACMEEAGDVLIPIAKGLIGPDHIHAELGEIAAGLKPGREGPDEITLFKSVGLALQDTAAAWEVLAAAGQAGLGQRIAL